LKLICNVHILRISKNFILFYLLEDEKEKQKKQMFEQKEGNKKIRAFYKKRSLDEIK